MHRPHARELLRGAVRVARQRRHLGAAVDERADQPAADQATGACDRRPPKVHAGVPSRCGAVLARLRSTTAAATAGATARLNTDGMM